MKYWNDFDSSNGLVSMPLLFIWCDKECCLERFLGYSYFPFWQVEWDMLGHIGQDNASQECKSLSADVVYFNV